MSRIERKELETAVSLREAKSIVESFCNDEVTYPREDVYSKRGICKTLAEEYCPLVGLAEELPNVRSVRLLPEANPGPDGEIFFWRSASATVQIVCANEGYNRALMRELLRNGKVVSPHQSHRRRDKASKEVVTTGSCFTTGDRDAQTRIKRILAAIRAKEAKFYDSTHTLLVQDDPARFKHLVQYDLHGKVCEAVRNGLGAPYERIYVRYGDETKRVK